MPGKPCLIGLFHPPPPPQKKITQRHRKGRRHLTYFKCAVVHLADLWVVK